MLGYSPMNLIEPLESLLPLGRIVLFGSPMPSLPATRKLFSLVNRVGAPVVNLSVEPSEPRCSTGSLTVTGLPAASAKLIVYRAPGTPEIWITSLLGNDGANVGPAKYGQLPSTLLVGGSQTRPLDELALSFTPTPCTVPVATLPLTDVQSVAAGAACAGAAAAAPATIAARAHKP